MLCPPASLCTGVPFCIHGMLLAAGYRAIAALEQFKSFAYQIQMEGYEAPSAAYQEGRRFSCVDGSLCEDLGALLDQAEKAWDLKERAIDLVYRRGLLMVPLQVVNWGGEPGLLPGVKIALGGGALKRT